jgi:exoribonuclease R
MGVTKRPKAEGETGAKIKDIDFRDFEKCCQMQCTQEEIAGWFEIDEETLVRRVTEHYNKSFSEVYKKYSAGGKCSLRRRQFRRAQNGDRVMMIWLGKQYLGQSEKVEQKVTEINLSDVPDHEIEALIKRYGKKPKGT